MINHKATKPLRITDIAMDRYDALFFDFDGVLADSVTVKTKAFAKLYEPYGTAIQSRVVEHHINNGGMSRFDKFSHYASEFLNAPLSQDGMDALCDEFARLVVDAVVAAPEIPGALKFVKSQYADKFCCIISGTPENELIEIVKRRDLTPYFSQLLGSPISKTEHTNALIEKYDLAPKKCLFLGDSGSDLRASQVTGTDFLGVLPNAEAPLLKANPSIVWIKNFQ